MSYSSDLDFKFPQLPDLTLNSSSCLTPSESFRELRESVAEIHRQTTEKFQELILELETKFEQFVQKYQESEREHDSFSTRITTAFGKLAEYVDIIADDLNHDHQEAEVFDKRLKFVEDSLENLKYDVMLLQYQDMQFAVRLRGLAEDPKENIKQVIAEAFMNILASGPEIYYELESVFRVNSCAAHQRNLPRDVVIYFTTKWRRNELVQLFHQQRFKILNQDIMLFREIPVKMLKERQKFVFLTQELRKRQIFYRWGIPTGIKVTLNGKFHKINSLEQANDFMVLLQADSLPISQNAEVEQLFEVSDIVIKEETPGVARKEQRWTKRSRAARKRKQKHIF